MRFSTVAIFATAVSAGSYMEYDSAKEHTKVVSAAPLVTGGPKHPKQKTTSTVYETMMYTVSDCPEEVTMCPYDSTSVVTETVAVSTTVCDVEEETEAPMYPTYHPINSTMSYKPRPSAWTEASSLPAPPMPTDEPACGATKVKTITSSYTTVIPTVIYETYTEECPEPTAPVVPSASAPAPVVGSCDGSNCSIPAVPTTPLEAGASSAVGSVFFAAIAGLAAYTLA